MMELADFVLRFAEAAVKQEVILQSALDEVGKRIQETAKEKIGEYQDGVGEFQAWPELAESTKADRERQGFSLNDPLLRTGELRDSIKRERDGRDVIVGSESPIAAYQEFGTSTIPPRPFIGPAAQENIPKALELIGRAAIEGMSYNAPSFSARLTKE